MKGIRRSDAFARPRPTGARLAFTIAALFALFLQTFVVQTHIHAIAFAPTSIERSAGHAADIAQAATDHQAACVICQTLASTGRATLTPASALILAQHAANDVAAIELRAAPRALVLPWQSRAPPIAL